MGVYQDPSQRAILILDVNFLRVLNFIFTEKFLRDHFDDDIVSKLVPKEEILPLPTAVHQYVTAVIQLAKEHDRLDWRLLLQIPEDGVSRSWCDLFAQWSRGNLMSFKEEDGRELHEELNTATFQMSVVDPVCIAFFNSMGLRLWK